jgi:hypothetical protein
LKISTTSSDSIWTTAWVPSLPSYRPTPKNPNQRNLPSHSISDLIVPGTWQWDVRFLYNIFDSISAAAISRLPISQTSTSGYLWTPSTSSRFTTHSTYLAILNNDFSGDSPHHPSSFWKDIWKLQLTDRLQLFLWKIAWNIFPTTMRLQSIIPSYRPDTPCPLCKVGPDSTKHLFFHCHYARVIWRLSPWPLDSTTLDSPNLCDWIRIILSPGATLNIPRSEHHRFQVFAAVTCDLLWFYRNKAFHDGLSFDARILTKLILKNYYQHCDAWSHKLDPIPGKWIRPPLHWLKINFDTAIRDSFSCQAAICRNHNGQLIKNISQIQSKCSPNKGEALATQLAISLASSLHLNRFILEGDSQVVTLTLQHPSIVQDWRITDIITNTLDSIPADASWSVRKVNRSANFGAHYVAHWAAARFSSSSIPTSSNYSLVPLVSNIYPLNNSDLLSFISCNHTTTFR